MATLLVGAVAMGIVSVCAIPFGCFVTRRFRRKANIQPEIVDLSQSMGAELVEECRYEVTPVPPKPSGGHGRVRIRVLVSNGSPKSMDLEHHGYVTTSEASQASHASQAARAIEARERISLPNPATRREIQGRNSSLPVKTFADYSESTRFEITISGGRPGAEFRSDPRDSSTPKSRGTSSAPSATDCSERIDDRTSFWRLGQMNGMGRDSIGGSGPSRANKSNREVGVIDIEITPEDGPRDRENPETEAATTASQGNVRNSDRGRWGLRGRFLETLKETTSVTNF